MASIESPPSEEVPRSLNSFTGKELMRQLSKGLTGETFYDYDLPVGREDAITILHFNDVYNVERSADGQGGVSRFVTALGEFSTSHPLILFSGDAFNPSTMSTHTRGRHMVPFLNMTKIHTACFGNHDFDFGIDHLEYLAGSTRFPWLMSNVFDVETNEPLANGMLYRLFEWQGTRVGIMGLVEKEWLETLACVDLDDVIYKDFVEQANYLSCVLRAKEAELIIALTHMRSPNDERLAREALDIDLILGGHDHEYYGAKRICGSVVVKSGCDFREFTKLVIYPGNSMEETTEVNYDVDDPPVGILKPGDRSGGILCLPNFRGGSAVEWQCVDVSEERYKANAHIDVMVGRYIQDIQAQMGKIICELSVPLETRFPVIRTAETNAGNWLCDLMRHECRADISVLNSGTIRSDCIFQPGLLRMRDLTSMLPMLDPLVMVGITGNQLIMVLENSVSMYPKTEGRFLQVSGIKFGFDPAAPQGSRVLRDSVQVLNFLNDYESIDLEKQYSLITKEYLQQGKDGFDVLTECEVLRDSEVIPNLPTMIRNALTMAAMANGFKRPHTRMMTKKLNTLTSMDAQSLVWDFGLGKVEKQNKSVYQLAPQCEGRIARIDMVESPG